MRSVRAVKGALFMAALVCLIFFLKVICPIDVGCLADPFLLVFFAPLPLLEEALEIPSSSEPLFLLGFWMLVGLITGSLIPPLKLEESDGRSEEPEDSHN